MTIKKVQVSNFKSFENLEIDLSDVNLLIGANASGKSNFIEIFKFLRDITKHGLDNAISMQGDIEYLRNIKLNSSKNLSLKIFFDENGFLPLQIKKKCALVIKSYESIYEFDLKFIKNGKDFEISKDKITYKCKFSELIDIDKLKDDDDEIKENELGSGKITIFNQDGKVDYDFELPEQVPNILKEHDFASIFYKSFLFSPKLKMPRKLPLKSLLIEHSFNFFPMLPPIENNLDNISAFDFDPKLPRNAISFTGKMELEEDGSNLTIVLKNILKDEDKKKKFTNLIKDLLPFVKDVDVEKFADKYLFFKLHETYSDQELPASLLSDGTINIIALVVAIYFNEGLTIIEEIERDIHPYLISKVMEMIIDASSKKQIIVTTHSPEILKYIDLKSILFIARNNNGFSTISRPIEKKEVKMFIEDEIGDIGIEDLYTQNLLEL